MNLPKALIEAAGSWTGESTLHMSWMPPGEQTETSKSSLHLEVSGDGAYATLTYTWAYKGKPQEGTLLLASDKNSNVSGGWADTWHQNTAVMCLSGKATPESVPLNGKYSVPGHPDWGWRVQITPTPERMSLQMVNISPDDKEEPAVTATYTRA